MILQFGAQYKKEYRKLSVAIRRHVEERITLFISDPLHPQLNNHALGGEYKGCRSINVTGDYRVIFYMSEDRYVFIRVGTHSQLYE